MFCITCGGAIYPIPNSSLKGCSICGIVYHKFPSELARPLIVDHGHEGLFPVGEAVRRKEQDQHFYEGIGMSEQWKKHADSAE